MVNLAACSLLLPAALAAETYQFPKNANPYSDRHHVARRVITRNVGFGDDHNNPPYIISPHKGHIYYPDSPGKYPWIDFFGGFFGMFPEIIYDEWVNEIVLQGFIVTYTSPHGHMEDTDNANFTIWKEQHEFYKANGNAIILEDSDGKVEMDTATHGEMSHSAGGQIIKQMMMDNEKRAGTYYMLDPVFRPGDDAAMSDVEINFTQSPVVVVQQTELCERCCTSQFDFSTRDFASFKNAGVKTYDRLKDKGHCSCLNYAEEEMCRIIHFCKQVRITRRALSDHHRCMAGVAVAAFTDGLFEGREDMRKYYANPAEFCEDYIIPETWICEDQDGSYCNWE